MNDEHDEEFQKDKKLAQQALTIFAALLLASMILVGWLSYLI